MLDYLRQRVSRLLAHTGTAILATSGPAGVQANAFVCESIGMLLYMLVPRTSDHLLNLEADPTAVATTAQWHARGIARIVPPEALPVDLMLLQHPDAPWCVVVELRPVRVEASRPSGWGPSETIDVDAL
jgi:hypothetical protein